MLIGIDFFISKIFSLKKLIDFNKGLRVNHIINCLIIFNYLSE